MKVKFKRFVGFMLMICTLVTLLPTQSIFAATKEDLIAVTGDSSMSEEAQQAQFECFSTMVEVMRAGSNGSESTGVVFSDVAIAGICANIDVESSFDPYITEGSNNYFDIYLNKLNQDSQGRYQGSVANVEGGVGIGQWTHSRRKNFSDFGKETVYTANPGSVRIIKSNWNISSGVADNSDTYVPSMGYQVAYIIEENHSMRNSTTESGFANYISSQNRNTAGYLTLQDGTTITDRMPASAGSSANNNFAAGSGRIKQETYTVKYEFPNYRNVLEFANFQETDKIRVYAEWTYTPSTWVTDGYWDYADSEDEEDEWIDTSHWEWGSAVTRTLELGSWSGVEAASIMWTISWEICQDYEAGALSRAEKADDYFTLINGTSFSEFVNLDEATIAAQQLSSNGYWTEDQLSAFARLTEIDLSHLINSATRENLDANKLNGLVGWETNVEMQQEESGWIATLRKIVMIIGIIFILWVMFIYIGYWFDRLNNFFYIDVLGILTFGHLHMSDTEQECTFGLGKGKSGGKTTVNHRAILTICLIGLVFGVLVVSGVFYSILAAFIQAMLNFFA